MKINPRKPDTRMVTDLAFLVWILAASCNARLFGSHSRIVGKTSRELQQTNEQSIREVPLPPTAFWFCENYCRQYHPVSWCDCQHTKTGSYYSPEVPQKADAYLFVYSVNGPVNVKLEYEECEESGSECVWKAVGPKGGLRVTKGALGALNKTSRSVDNRYRYSVVPESAEIRYHLSAFDVNEYEHEMCILKNGKG